MSAIHLPTVRKEKKTVDCGSPSEVSVAVRASNTSRNSGSVRGLC